MCFPVICELPQELAIDLVSQDLLAGEQGNSSNDVIHCLPADLDEEINCVNILNTFSCSDEN